MKKILFTIASLLLCANLTAQNRVYCEIVEPAQLGKKVKIIIDFGQERKKSKAQQTLVNKNGEEIQFNSKIDALNYMTTLGWNFVQAYTVATGSGGCISSTIHWVLSKNVDNDEDPYSGITTKEAYDKVQSK
jgi:hypothetical protein